MRILIITEEDEFYLPRCLHRCLRKVVPHHHIVGVVLAKNTLLPSPWAAARKFVKVFGVWPVIQQAFRLARAKFFDKVFVLRRRESFYSMKAVCKSWNIQCTSVDDVNADDFVQNVLQQNVDLIVSISPTQKFKAGLLGAAPEGSINIHSSRLPKYRGLYPTYWAMACGEKKSAVSVHFMNDKIDEGGVILQREVEIVPRCSMDQMLKRAKDVGADLLVEAIDQISKGAVEPIYPEGAGSYYSFPTKESYKEFRRRGYRLW